jgi:hypothetical protein
MMKIFTIDEQNDISAFGSQPEAAAAHTTLFDSFNTQKELAALLATWPAERLVAVWNSLPGVTPAKSCKDPQSTANRIWKRIQGLGATEQPEQTANPKADQKAKAGAQSAMGAPAKGKATQKAPAAKRAPRSKKAAQAQNTAAPRKGSKTAQVVSMLQRKSGATIAEIMKTMGWQRHTVRGFIAGAMRKAGYQVESFRPEGGERTYRINK